MTDDAFLADILENPDDDAPRLIYADWLDDHDQPERAEFIRLQCYRERGESTPESKLREDALLEKHLVAWVGPLHNFLLECRFRRGFLESVDIALTSLVAHHGLFAKHPIRFLECHNARAADVQQFAKLDRLGPLAGFSLSGSFREAAVRSLLDSPNVQQLRGLSLHDTPIGLKGLRLLLAWANCASLTHLSLANTSLGPNGVKELAECNKLKSLIGLDLRGNAVTGDGMRRIGDSPYLKKVQRLGLWYNRLGDAGVERLVEMPLFAGLRHLELGYNGLTVRGIRALAESPALVNLRTLWLGVDRYTEEGMLALAQSPNLHPEARVMFWFFSSSIEEQTRSRIRDVLGERADFDGADNHREENALVRWPMWQAEWKEE